MKFAKRHKGTGGILLFAVIVVSLYAYWGSILLERHTNTAVQGQVSQK
jgi:hypothetical protein